MFGFGKKEPYDSVNCKASKSEKRAGRALIVRDFDITEVVRKADQSEHCYRIVLGDIYQKPGTLLAENNKEEQGYHARWDKLTGSIGVSLFQGYMRQTLVFSTKEPQLLTAEMGITLEVAGPSEPTTT
ncbi:hypothetical protein KSF73_11895 [Burkholderiaceae bacterium DAT-1]|nr:hypothetical protein [Burkholderiaceae bacterium DAT-1]